MKPMIGLLIGLAFGFILHRAGITQYRNILNMLRLRDFHVMKFMFTAIAVSMAGTYLLDLAQLANFSIKSTYVLGLIVGGVIFGVGFAVSGYCPGTAVCALAEGKRDAAFTVLGGLVGALAYIFAYPHLKPLLVDPLSFGKITLAGLMPWPEIITALVFAAALGGVVALLPRSRAT